jgi:L-fucose isomerase-like protein
MENSELDLLDIFNKAKNDPSIEKIAKEMATELGMGKPNDFLKRLAQYEICLTKFYKDNLGASEYGIFAIKCWPSFESFFGFVPCYINSRLAGKGIPVSCEVDIYGALSEYMAYAASELPPTILDINNTVPKDMAASIKGYKLTDLFMGFHCGNTPSTCMKSCNLKYQLIMHRLLEPEKEPEITRGTLEGQLKSGAVTIFRLQSTADCQLRSYIAQGEVLDIDPQSFGGIGVFAIKEMGRFYRHVLVARRYPHHTAVAFAHVGKILFNVLRVIGIEEIAYNQPKGVLYKEENPFD